jgi:hypothetical protein
MKKFMRTYSISGDDLSALPVIAIGPAVTFYQSVLGWRLCAAATMSDDWDYDELADMPTAIVRRGFVHEIYCTLAEWVGGPEAAPPPPGPPALGPALVTGEPVEVVWPTDRRPARRGPAFQWAGDPSVADDPRELLAVLPPAVFDLLPPGDSGPGPWKAYPSLDAAAALSAALIAWALAQPAPEPA